MQDVLHANIFFFIASIATVLFALILCLILYQVYKIVRTVRRIVDRIEAGSELIAEDVAHLRSYVMNGNIVARILGFVFGATAKKTRRRRSRQTEDVEE